MTKLNPFILFLIFRTGVIQFRMQTVNLTFFVTNQLTGQFITIGQFFKVFLFENNVGYISKHAYEYSVVLLLIWYG